MSITTLGTVLLSTKLPAPIPSSKMKLWHLNEWAYLERTIRKP